MSTEQNDLYQRLDALSDDAKEWLETTCNRFAEGEGYPPHPEEIEECLAAGIIDKRGKFIEIDSSIMDLVYSEGYFKKPA